MIMFIYLLIILCASLIVFIMKRNNKNKIGYRLETIEKYTDEKNHFGKLIIADPNDVCIENDDDFFYESIENKFDIYKEVCEDALAYREYIESGYSVEELKLLKLKNAEATFGMNAIMGTIIDGKIYLTNGRHRCVVAKKLNIPVIMYVDGKYSG